MRRWRRCLTHGTDDVSRRDAELAMLSSGSRRASPSLSRGKQVRGAHRPCRLGISGRVCHSESEEEEGGLPGKLRPR